MAIYYLFQFLCRCSEKTLEVLRKSQDVLLTILDVLLHDPLYEWTVPSSKSPSAASSKVQSHGKILILLKELIYLIYSANNFKLFILYIKFHMIILFNLLFYLHLLDNQYSPISFL